MIGRILSAVLPPEKLLELYRDAYKKVESGLPLLEARIMDKISVTNPVADSSLDVFLFEGKGIPIVTPQSEKTKKIWHQFFYDSEKWFEVGHYSCANPQAFSKDILPYSHIPTYHLELIGNVAYPIEIMEKPILREDRQRYNLTIPTIVPQGYVFHTLKELIGAYPEKYNEISFIFTRYFNASSVREILLEHDYTTEKGVDFWRNEFMKKISEIKPERHRERKLGDSISFWWLEHMYEGLNTLAERLKKCSLEDQNLREAINTKKNKLIEETKRSIKQTRKDSDFEKLMKKIQMIST